MQSTPLSRRQLLQQVGPLAAALALAGSAPLRSWADPDKPRVENPLKPEDVLRQLLEGNLRFARGEAVHPRRKPEDFKPLAEGQNPHALILGCADSRVAPELIFDQGIGDLFVVRLAGNVVNGTGPAINGSIEYAVAELNVPLVVVLGHSQCGALKAAMKHIDSNDPLPGAIDDLIHLVKPAVARSRDKPGNHLDNAIKANVEMGVERLRGLQPILGPRVKQGKLKVVGAVYDLKSGRVNVLK